MDPNLKILVTDGSYKHTLALIRDLAGVSPGIQACCSSQHSIFLSMFSHSCRSALRCPDPVRNFEIYTAWLEKKYASHQYRIIIPVGSESNLAVSKIDPELVRKKSMTPEPSIIQMASDKMATAMKMIELKVPVPRTLRIRENDDIARAFLELSGEMVLKPMQGARSAGLFHIKNETQLIQATRKLKHSADLRYIAQERITGQGVGYSGLYAHGRRLAHFMHQRLREYPLSGGISVVARSIKDRHLFELGDSIFRSLQWNGVGMLEFRRSEEDGRLVLIEINPGFWDSLELAIVSGVNFPSLMVKYMLGENFPEPDYREDTTFNWMVPWNSLYFLSKVKGRSLPPYTRGKGGHYNEYCPGDMMPFLFQLALLPYHILKEWKRL